MGWNQCEAYRKQSQWKDKASLSHGEKWGCRGGGGEISLRLGTEGVCSIDLAGTTYVLTAGGGGQEGDPSPAEING